MITKQQIDNLPSETGVYLFKKRNEILYIGKSVNIKARVRSHIENAKLDRKESLIIENSDFVDSITTENEFSALILESNLIKKNHPKYNVIWKDGKNYLYIQVTKKDDYPKILLSRKPDLDKNSLFFGPFSSSRVVETLLKDIRRIIPFCIEKHLSKSPCFYKKINLCQPCPNDINQVKDEAEKKNLKKIYRKNIRKIIKILNGGVVEILNENYRLLKNQIKLKNYEEAILTRDKIFRLERLINHPTSEIKSNLDLFSKNETNQLDFLTELKKYFPSLNKIDRIEAYDISNLSQKNQTGSMVVLTKGRIDKKEYRKFKIKNTRVKSDFKRLEEILLRRFNNDWHDPDLIIVDGGKPQVKVVLKILNIIHKEIPVLGIAKNPDRLVIGADVFLTIRFPQTNPSFNLIRLIRDESHRFAKKYHLYLRKRDFLI